MSGIGARASLPNMRGSLPSLRYSDKPKDPGSILVALFHCHDEIHPLFATALGQP